MVALQAIRARVFFKPRSRSAGATITSIWIHAHSGMRTDFICLQQVGGFRGIHRGSGRETVPDRAARVDIEHGGKWPSCDLGVVMMNNVGRARLILRQQRDRDTVLVRRGSQSDRIVPLLFLVFRTGGIRGATPPPRG